MLSNFVSRKRSESTWDRHGKMRWKERKRGRRRDRHGTKGEKRDRETPAKRIEKEQRSRGMIGETVTSKADKKDTRLDGRVRARGRRSRLRGRLNSSRGFC